MKILHICNDLYGSKVHANLYRNLVACGLEQTLFVPLRSGVDTSSVHLPECVTIHQAEVVKPYHRYLYHIKRQCVFNALRECEKDMKYDLIHATTLFSDGGIAYLTSKKWGIPYVVTVRNTDVNGFLRLLPHTWFSGWRILLNASRIVFVSKALMDKFSDSWVIRPILSRIKEKFVLQPNGLDDYWCDHVRRELATHNHKIIYVGDFSRNKNLDCLVEAVGTLRKEKRFSDVTLTLVGGGKDESAPLLRRIASYDGIVSYFGKVKDREKLCEIYREHSIFAMPSIYETFGLVYVEALSQNLALLYTKGQGIDGLFDDRAGERVVPTSVKDLTSALAKMLDHRASYSNAGVDFDMFRWATIAERYKAIYEQVLEKETERL